MSSAIKYFRSVIDEERIIQGSWNKVIGGKEYVCLAAAWGRPGTISSISDCPFDLFPRWVFQLMPILDDGIAASEIYWLFNGFSDRAEKMAAFSSEQWDSIRTAFMIGTIDIAITNATAVQSTPAPKYWQAVVDACRQVKEALKLGDRKLLNAAAHAAANAACKEIASIFFACVDLVEISSVKA